ncbi:prostaglandin reductase 1 [Diabrotica virgifera virgifera]|uniref:Prostaglandin reductase 1 n=1 Tax=Diabrotica virgifera virgifera TaxID=50390 RepID=A0ABM5IB94_DIAVI|nr:prostaglandin reductase 1 [Diabrotica virgifera virgifera]
MVKANVFLFEKHFEGFPKPENVKLVEEELGQIKNGEFLAEALYISVDPFIRARAPFLPLGQTMIGVQVARILESKNPKFPVGGIVVGFFGWRTHTISNGSHPQKDKVPQLIKEDLGDISLSALLGVLGRPGHSAYFCLLDICKPKAGDTIVVSGAAGAVGSLVGQIAKIKGCKVIGIAGSDEKGKWLVEELGFDHFINYKTESIDAAIKKYAPNGVDSYFDNIGGEISSTVIWNLKKFGRVGLCGSISQYNETNKVTSFHRPIISNELFLQGFQCATWVDRWSEAVKQNLEWIKEGKLKYRETVTEGFENTYQAFIDMLSGKNVGKAVVKV